MPAFVLYTLDATVVVPTDGSERVRGEGLWIQDDRSAAPRVSHTLILDMDRLRRMGIPDCPCDEIEGACAWDRPYTTDFDLSTLDVVAETDPQCRCSVPPPPVGEFLSDDDSCDTDEDMEFVSLVGGWLYSLGYEWNGACDGAASVYDSLSAAYPVVEEPTPLDHEGMTALGCDPIMTAEIERPRPDGGEPVCPSDEDNCALCEDGSGEAEVFVLRRGSLWHVMDEINHASGGRWSARSPARPDRCPSVNDPCGEPSAIDDPEDLLISDELWVATDGHAALTASEHDYAIHGADGDYDTFELPEIDATEDVIGVRQHVDAGPLIAVMKRHADRGTVPNAPPFEDTCGPPPLAAEDEDFVDTRGGRGWGNRCFAHIKAERWDAAEAACLRGLEQATEGGVRGALLYNMGRISEGRGEAEDAAAFYRQSLEARPGNAAVRKRLERLEAETGP